VRAPVRELEPGLWLKDEAPLGGNKVRKLARTLPGARGTVLTFGGLGSHHCVATARACAESGRRCVLALVDQPEDDHVRAQLAAMEAAGAAVLRLRTRARVFAALPWLLLRHRPTVLPVGGSSALGVAGWVDAAHELALDVREGRLPAPARIVVPVGSGGTAAGLLAGLPAAGLASTRVTGVLVNDRTRIDVPRMARKQAPALAPYEETADFIGAGYGHATPAGEAAIAQAAALGVRLEPVYGAKAWAAMRALPGSDGPTLFWQTWAGP
jgi:D-cysteine desulfhydrase